ncbi:hypothetical protein LguiA_032710 [Lonicera macranthoides]
MLQFPSCCRVKRDEEEEEEESKGFLFFFFFLREGISLICCVMEYSDILSFPLLSLSRSDDVCGF